MQTHQPKPVRQANLRAKSLAAMIVTKPISRHDPDGFIPSVKKFFG
jgi:hypothetical protein